MFQNIYVINSVGQVRILCFLTRWVGGSKKSLKYAYVMYEWFPSTKLLQELRQEIKSATLLRSANNAASAAKSFSSRFVSQVKAESAPSGTYKALYYY